MQTIHLLVAIDGSAGSEAAVCHAVQDAATRSLPVHLHLVNVQPVLPGDVTRFIEAQVVRDFQREAGDEALATALRLARDAALAHSAHVLVGEAAPALVEFAQQNDCSAIIIGTRGLGGVSGWLLGSVATRVANLATQPVVLVKEPELAA